MLELHGIHLRKVLYTGTTVQILYATVLTFAQQLFTALN